MSIHVFYVPGTNMIGSAAWQNASINTVNTYDQYKRLTNIAVNGTNVYGYTLNDKNQRTIFISSPLLGKVQKQDFVNNQALTKRTLIFTLFRKTQNSDRFQTKFGAKRSDFRV